MADVDDGASLPSVPAAHLNGHEGPVQVVRFTHDGKYCLTAGADRTIRLWNPFREDPVSSSSSSSKQNMKNNNAEVRRWEEEEDEMQGVVDRRKNALPIMNYSELHSYAVSSLALDHESRKMISSSEKTLVLSDVVTGKIIRKIHGGHDFGRINSVACSSDLSMFISGSYDSTVRVWDGRSRSTEPIQIMKEARDSVSTVELVHDAKEIVASSIDGCVRTYDVRNGKLRVDTCHDAVTSVCMSNDGLCTAASCLDGNIHLIERETGILLNTYANSHKAGKYGIECCITSNDAYIVSGSEDGHVVMYDLVSGHAKVLGGARHDRRRPTCSIAAHPDRKKWNALLSASYDGDAILWLCSSDAVGWGLN